jgi:hypothetical protein
MGKTDLSLVYTPTDNDLTSMVPRGSNRTSRSSYLSVFGTSDYLVHGNSFIKVMQNGGDVSSRYATWRWWRIWHGAKLDQDWLDDNLSKRSNWVDIPGMQFADGPDKWRDEQYLLEFVVSVDGHTTESGALYIFVGISVKPGQYRVEMSSAKTIPFTQWKELSRIRRPWRQLSGCAIALNSGWMSADVE